jgi:ribosome-binding factor A
MSSKRRLARLREEIQRELASIVEFESRDPVVRAAFPTVMEVRLSPDARHAKVYVAAGADDADRDAFYLALVRDRGFYRSELAERLSLRHTPEIQFVIDEAVERSIRLGELLREDDKDLGTE